MNKTLINWLIKKWSNYRYRFLPWIFFNLKKEIRIPNQINEKSILLNDSQYIEQLKNLFEQFQPLEPFKSGQTLQRINKIHSFNNQKLLEIQGFSLVVKSSSIPDAGNGVFVKDGEIKSGQLVSLYPGTIYYPFNSILFQSINNPYIFRCVDDLRIDGNNKGISRMVYKSIHGRDRIGIYPICDISWILNNSKPINPLNIGQIINNATKNTPSNVMYHELNVRTENIHPKLLEFFPNNFYESLEEKPLRILPIIATKDISKGEELFSTYFSLIDN